MTIRLLPDEAFPPYTFVPGLHPHPESDPKGHSFGVPRTTPQPLTEENWPTSRPYLRGLDLFNARYFWEAHVEFESLWIASGRSGSVASFMKGLIKLAAAGVKHLENRPDGVRSHADRAADIWREVACSLGSGQDFFLGFCLSEMIDTAEKIRKEGWVEPFPVLLPTLPDATS